MSAPGGAAWARPIRKTSPAIRALELQVQARRSFHNNMIRIRRDLRSNLSPPSELASHVSYRSSHR